MVEGLFADYLVNPSASLFFSRRNPMNHDLIVEQLFERCKWFMENTLQAPDLVFATLQYPNNPGGPNPERNRNSGHCSWTASGQS
jgi:hypothetical protein